MGQDYEGRPESGGIRDMAEDAREAVQFFKNNRPRLERMLEFGCKMADAVERSALVKWVLGIK